MDVGFVNGSFRVKSGGVSGTRRCQVFAKTTVYSGKKGPKFAEVLGDKSTVYDVDGKKQDLKAIVSEGGKATVVTWTRHYGCTLCRKQVSELGKLQEQGIADGVRFILVGSGTPQQGADFLRESNFNGEIYSDPERRTYQALAFSKGVMTTFTAAALPKLFESFMSGNQQRLDIIPTDPFQQGGCIIIANDGSVVLFHKDDFAGDHVDEASLKKAIESAKVAVAN